MILDLKDEPRSIVERLEKRDNSQYDLELIKVFQEEELKYSLDISKKLGILYLVLDNSLKRNGIMEIVDEQISKIG